ncbi:MAG: hypothetical protein M1608_09835 [Candidatus Omnitrophica bacterium]|nr:hypothetical protein [Candidatus Omnitrophota bacterium]
MKMISNNARVVSLAIAVGVMIGALTFWLLGQRNDARKFNALKANALCELQLPEGIPSASATFTNTRPIELFHVGLTTKANREALSIFISGDQGFVASASGMKASMFGLGRRIQPGTYTVTLRQEIRGKGGMAVISAEEPVYVTGWQIWSRTYVGFLALSGICVVALRKAKDSKKRELSIAAFQSLLLGLVLIFVYLLFHEGGHALAQIKFGHFDIARSDFWGIHGHPHSGGTMGPELEPWQQEVISCAGPMVPTFAGFGLFLLWGLPIGRKLRSLRPMVNLYFSAIVSILVFPEAVCGPAYLLGFITAEGDLIGYVTRTGGPVWLVKGFLSSTFLISAAVLWQVIPEIRKAWKTRFLHSRKLVCIS